MAKRDERLIEEAGIRVRLFERDGMIYRDVATGRTVSAGGKARTKHNIRSLKHGDWKLAQAQAREFARALAGAELAGRPPAEPSFGDVRRIFLRERWPLLKPSRQLFVARALELLSLHLEPAGRPFRMDDFAQHHADGYAAARRAGTLRSSDHRSVRGSRDGTIRNELQALSAMCNWAVGYKTQGRRLLAHNPVNDIRLPAEKNPRRPVASADRFRKILGVANQVDPSGQFRLMLMLAYFTARRINAICHVRVSDLLLTADQLRRGVAALGMDEDLADEWSQAIRWRAEWDKKGLESVAPIAAELRRELDAYQRRYPAVGDAWLFNYARRPGEATPKNAADWWLKQAEKAAKLPHLERGGWHAFRRAWASQRRHLPVQDVMQAGGWRDVKALQASYQQADAKTVRAVVELSETA